MIIKREKNKTRHYFYRFFKEVFKIDKMSIAMTALYSFILSFGDVLTTYLPKYFVDSLSQKKTRTAVQIIVIYVLTIIFFNFMASIFSVVLNKRKEQRKLYFINKLFSHTFCVKQEYIESANFYNEYSMREANLEKASDSVTQCFNILFQQILTVTFIIGILSQISILMAIIITIPIFVNLVISLYVNGLYKEEQIEKQKSDRKVKILSRIFYQSNSIRDIKMRNMASPVMDQLENTFQNRLSIHQKYLIKSSKMLCISSIITEMLPLISMGVFGYYVYIELIDISTYYVYIAFYARLKVSIESILSLIPRVSNISIWTKDYYEYIDNKSILSVDSNNGEDLYEINSIEFKNVSYQYPNSTEYALKNVSFKIQKGTRNIIIGLNGAGKSTLLKLLCGLYSPTHGEVLVNEKKIETIKLLDVRSQIAVLFQDYFIFPFTIKENITSFDGKQEKELKMKELSNYFDLHSKIINLKLGYNTGVKAEYCDEYADFSGGEFQKMELITCFCKTESSLFLLDEPLNNIDIKTEDKFYDHILNSLDKTYIIISHSLKIAPQVDNIIYLENGSIVANGTHDSLMKDNCKYINLYNSFVNKYVSKK